MKLYVFVAALTLSFTQQAIAQFKISPRTEKFGDQIGMDKLGVGIIRRDVGVLSVIPVPGRDRTLANLFKRQHLVIAKNADSGCAEDNKFELAGGPGCYVIIFVSRQRANGQYSDLAGFRSIWFRGLKDSSFRPANHWAQHISKDDSWIQSGSIIDQQDRP